MCAVDARSADIKPVGMALSTLPDPKLVVFPGTFNPFHRGHAEAVVAAAFTDLATGRQTVAAQRGVVVCLCADPKNPHKPAAAAAAERIKLAELALADIHPQYAEFTKIIATEGSTAVPDLRGLLEVMAVTLGAERSETALLCGDDALERMSDNDLFGQRVLVMDRWADRDPAAGGAAASRAGTTVRSWSVIHRIGSNSRPFCSTAARLETISPRSLAALDLDEDDLITAGTLTHRCGGGRSAALYLRARGRTEPWRHGRIPSMGASRQPTPTSDRRPCARPRGSTPRLITEINYRD